MKSAVETPQEREARIAAIQERVVGMYDRVPSPGEPNTDDEMQWRLRVLGVQESDYAGKTVVDLGCGAGDYALWYATHGAGHVTGVDLSKGSLARAVEKAETRGVRNIEFLNQDILKLALPSNHFDYGYSAGVLHHTGDTHAGFQQLVRIVRPGGMIIVSLYNTYTRLWLRGKQTICKWLGGDDIDARARWGRRLFPFYMRALRKRYYGEYYIELSYDVFGFPHETLHTAGEVLKWFDETGVEYIGGFAPLRLKDYFYAFSLPEYRKFRQTFDGFPAMRLTADAFAKVATRLGSKGQPPFPRPGPLSRGLCQLAWVPFSKRFQCFTMAGRKVGP